MKFQRSVAILLVTTLLAGCNPPPPGAGQDTGGVSKQDIGTAVGAVGGGLLGSAFGRGAGQVAAIAGGAVIGGLVGNSIGKSLDRADAAAANQAAQNALENNSNGQATPWKGQQSGNYGSVTPTNTYQMADGTYCREYTQSVAINGQPQTAYGKACRQPDGSWKIVQ